MNIRQYLKQYPEYREIVDNAQYSDESLFIHFANKYPADAEKFVNEMLKEKSFDEYNFSDDEFEFNPLLLLPHAKDVVERAIKTGTNIGKTVVKTAKDIAKRHMIKIEPKQKESPERKIEREKKQTNIIMYIAIGLVAVIILFLVIKK